MALTQNRDWLSIETRVGGGEGRGFGVDCTQPLLPSYIALVGSGGTEWLLWVDGNGDLRIGTRVDFVTPDAAGTVVGTQT